MYQTIFAQSSAPGKAGVSVFRVSGPNALLSLRYFSVNIIPIPKKVYLVNLYHPKTDTIIDKSIMIYFKAPNSFTGEDIIEFHVHGSIAVCKLLIDSMLAIKNFRLAEPGEFAKRAFLNEKMDLTAAEGLSDLIDAETELQHKQAIRQFSGELEKIYSQWRKQLLHIISNFEAYIDFPEDDILESVINVAEEGIDRLIIDLESALHDDHRGERLRNGLILSIIGSPNVGKSSLMNWLSKRDVAIVSNIPGTTRDIIETYIDIGGYPITLADTAGICESTDIIEQQGIKKALKIAENSDIKLLVFDVDNFIKDQAQFVNIIDNNTIIILNKIDITNPDINTICEKICKISVKEGIGLKELVKQIIVIAENIIKPASTPAITRIRHRNQIKLTVEHLKEAKNKLKTDVVLCVEDIRLAINHLSMLTGIISVDDILGEIFANFCIGK